MRSNNAIFHYGMSDKQIIKKLEKEFSYVDSKVMEMRTEAEHMAGDARERFGREIDSLKSRADRMKTEFLDAKEGKNSRVDELVKKYQDGLEDIKKAFKSMRDRFS